MKWPQVVIIVSTLVLTLGALGFQVWLAEQQTARLRENTARYAADLARHRADLERLGAQQRDAEAKYQADLARYWADLKAKGQPGMPMPMRPMVPILPLMPMAPMPTMQPPILFPFGLIFLLVLPFTMAAEQERLRKLYQEEEDRTSYTLEDLMENWEFKIIRCALPLFEQPAFLESVLREEARAGWQLVEKFDGMRVRLKRLGGQPPVAGLPVGYDPYRTAVGPKAKFHVVLWFGCVACLGLLLLFIVLQFVDPIAPLGAGALIAGAAVGAIVFGVFAVRQIAKYRKQVNAG